MKCIVISDSHSYGENIAKVIAKNPDADMVFFLGDGIWALEEYVEKVKDKIWLCVLGNCDKPTAINGRFVKKVESVNICGTKIILTHGDMYGAKYGRGGLISLALEEGARAVLYGHTHTPSEEYITEHGIWLFNPGALEPSGGTRGTFGILTVNEKGEFLFSHGML